MVYQVRLYKTSSIQSDTWRITGEIGTGQPKV